MKVENTALSIKHIAEMYCVNGKHFADLYKHKLSDFVTWVKDEYDGFYINLDNLGKYVSMDETCLSTGEVWTFITNKDAKCGKGSLIAAIPGTKSDVLISKLIPAFGKDRYRVAEVTTDLSPSMMLVAQEVFSHARLVNDRFHVQQVYNEALDDIRIDIRRELLKNENAERDLAKKEGRDYKPKEMGNGETMRQILARSKHTLMMARNKWTDVQRHRVNILFQQYPVLKQAYDLSMELRHIFNKKVDNHKGGLLLAKWYDKVEAVGNENFRSVIKTFKNNSLTIANYFCRKATNASAEAFNSKVKIFRTQMRGVRDTDFFVFRLVKLFG